MRKRPLAEGVAEESDEEVSWDEVAYGPDADLRTLLLSLLGRTSLPDALMVVLKYSGKEATATVCDRVCRALSLCSALLFSLPFFFQHGLKLLFC